jgi:estrone sulfotransferase
MAAVRKVAGFLGQSLTDQQVFDIVRMTRFEEMRHNPLANYSWWDELGFRQKGEAQFLRKGKHFKHFLHRRTSANV